MKSLQPPLTMSEKCNHQLKHNMKLKNENNIFFLLIETSRSYQSFKKWDYNKITLKGINVNDLK